jgi:hypothetical protein
MEAMRLEIEASGIPVNVVGINIVGGQGSIANLATRTNYDCLQDVAPVGAWNLLGGQKDDFFIYRAGGRLSAYYSQFGSVNVNLSTPEGYANIRAAVEAASAAGPGESCPDLPQEGHMLPSDFNADRSLDISDAVGLLGHLFLGSSVQLPCGGTDRESPANRTLLDANADGEVDISDAVNVLNFLFFSGPPPAAGTTCIAIAGCPEACAE